MVDAEEEKLQAIFDANAKLPIHLRDQLSYHHMSLLADAYTEWADDPRISPERAVMLLGMAEGMRGLAWLVGAEWKPPEPKRLSLVGFTARQLEEAVKL